jgi:hypothetical protein
MPRFKIWFWLSTLPRACDEGFWVFLRLKNAPAGKGTEEPENRRNMARPGQDKFIKRQKELDRIKRATEKMAKRQQQKKDNITKENE